MLRELHFQPAGNRSCTRLTALVLALLFLLQSAAQAGSGCVARVLVGSCCCASAKVDSEPVPAERSCCAARSAQHHADASGPHVGQQSDCHCQLAPAPNAPADKGSSPVCERSRGQRGADVSDGFATWIAQANVTAVLAGTAFDPPLFLAPFVGPPGPPPRTSRTFAATRLAQRGVIGLLSELCIDRS